MAGWPVPLPLALKSSFSREIELKTGRARRAVDDYIRSSEYSETGHFDRHTGFKQRSYGAQPRWQR